MNDPVLCSHCRFPISSDARGLRYYGTHVAHQEDVCISLLRAEIEWLRSGVRVCTCHPDDNPPKPCAERYAFSECVSSALK